MSLILSAMLSLSADGVTVPPVVYVSESPEPAAMGAVACHEAFQGIPDNRQRYCPDGFTGAIVYGPLTQYWTEHVIAHESYHLAHPGVGPDPSDPFSERAATAYACSIRPHVYLCGGAK